MRVSPTTSFRLQAAMAILAVAGATVPTPLYAIYQRMWGFSPTVLTLVFAVYAIAVLASLLVLGRLSDHVGRRPVLLGAALGQVGAMGLFATAAGVPDLLAARVLQGLATGAAVAAAGAGLMDLQRERGAAVNALSPMVGTAAGTLVAGLMAQFLPFPTLTVYLVFAAVFLALTLGAAAIPETVTPRPGALASLRPSVGLPAVARAPFLAVLPGLVAAWAVPGFFASLGPGLVNHLAGRPLPALGGMALTVLAVSGVAAVLLAGTRAPRVLLQAGAAGLAGGVAVILVAVAQGWLPLFFAGAVVTGAGFGATFQGAVRTVAPLAEAHERAGVLAVVNVVAYLSMGLPAVLGGWRATQAGLATATVEYGVVVMALAGAALAGAWRTRVRAARAA